MATGEVVFNTVLSGYQEVITDPSYAGQVIAFTYPTSATTASPPTTTRAAGPFCRGVIVRDLARRPQQLAVDRGPRATSCVRHGVPGHRPASTPAG